MTRTWIAVGALALAAAAARAQGVRQVTVPREYGLGLASASPMMHYASDVTFDGDSLHARGGVAALEASETAFTPSVTTSATALPLAIGTLYLVNDRSDHTYVVRVVGFDDSHVSLTVAPAAATLKFEPPAPPPPPPAAPAASSPAATAPPAGPTPSAPPPPKPLPPLEGRHISLRAYRMEGGSVTKYQFNPDGSFRREWIFRSYLGSNSSEDRGEYAIQGSTLVLRIGSSTNAALGGAGSNGYQTAGGSSAVKEERHSVSLRGSSGIVIDGKLFEKMTGDW